MSEQIIKLSDNAAERIKQIMSKAENSAIGVRVGVKSGGCAGMSYVMEYANEIKPNEEVIEEKGVKVFIDPKFVLIASFLNLSHRGAPTKAASGMINSFFFTSFLINFLFLISSLISLNFLKKYK